jgi:hypothetical protein
LEEMTSIDKEIRQLEKPIEKKLDERSSLVKSPFGKMSSTKFVGFLNSSSSSSSSGSDVEEWKCKEVEDLQKFLLNETMGMIEECLKTGPKKFDR